MAQTQDIDQLIAQLGDFRTRAQARRQLQALGSVAAERLMAVLQRPESPENLRWSAVTLLAACKCEEATPLFVDLLRNDLKLRGEAVRALQSITGHDIGEDLAAWEKALNIAAAEEAEPAEDAATEEHEGEPAGMALFRKALGGVAVQFSWEEPGYLYMRVPLSEGRKQQMIVTFDDKDANDEPLTTFYTECGPASSQAVDIISRRNVTLKHGTFEVETDDDGSKKIVMRCKAPTASVAAVEARDIILNMAREADLLEFELTGTDRI